MAVDPLGFCGHLGPQEKIDEIARQVNERPRKTSNYKHPRNDFTNA
jgi:IS30 family transposase